jgi:hypothetical protein
MTRARWVSPLRLHPYAVQQDHPRHSAVRSRQPPGGRRPHPLLHRRITLGVITGEVGVGKTVALRAATSQLDPRRPLHHSCSDAHLLAARAVPDHRLRVGVSDLEPRKLS